MQEHVYYEDEALRVTASEIRMKRLTIRTNSVTSVSVASVRPGKWFPVLILIPMLPVYYFLVPMARMFGFAGIWLLTPMVIPTVIVVLLSFLRVSRIDLQTSGGPVVLAVKAELGDATATLARYHVIRDSIEQALRAG
jgi:ABC-type proline/glycine betaine transport system permease subunit